MRQWQRFVRLVTSTLRSSQTTGTGERRGRSS